MVSCLKRCYVVPFPHSPLAFVWCSVGMTLPSRSRMNFRSEGLGFRVNIHLVPKPGAGSVTSFSCHVGVPRTGSYMISRLDFILAFG